MKVPWASVEAPDDEAETHDKRDSGENYIWKLKACKPPATVAVVSAEQIDREAAKRGALVDEENGAVVQEIINERTSRFFRRHH